MLLEVVALAWDVGGHFHAIRKAHAGDLTDSRVRLTRGLRGYLRADATLERSRVERRAVLKRVEATAKSHNLSFAVLALARLL